MYREREVFLFFLKKKQKRQRKTVRIKAHLNMLALAASNRALNEVRTCDRVDAESIQAIQAAQDGGRGVDLMDAMICTREPDSFLEDLALRQHGHHFYRESSVERPPGGTRLVLPSDPDHVALYVQNVYNLRKHVNSHDQKDKHL
jgi:hypothetical protein